ncbi:MAG: cell filamentation protein Fic [Syntrophaceae bacterium CG2_30_49_12]|nr:MAG: cell filamentation protein Fic [Syntrophaceae bacterium CG2_30_49_12]PIP06762.1 MAG: cell filamentation protein Fic [Syntrophobacterales bacterium CG23_combo_of_CG06-09_8_20_14_all_48_27]PJC72691.1 MAG: Fic family protein [Syntrophobacterales bacterium CG_4_8_14_3_um_filter_49_14]
MKPIFTITNKVADALTRIERARGFLEAAKLSEDWIRDMGQQALVREAHATTHIEGSHLTLEQSERLLAGHGVLEADPEDTRELLNYKQAFDFVADYVAGGDRVTEGLIREIHKRLVEGVRGGSAAPGEYRKIQNYVVNSANGQVVYTPPPACDVPILMGELIGWINATTEVHPVLVSGIAQFQLVHIHPFLDGNGRTSRLLSTLCLYRAGYDFKRLFTISEYYDRDRALFYRAIQSVRENGMDMTGWVEFYADGLATQMREVTEKGERVIRRDVLVKQHGLNKRQAAAIGCLLEHAEFTIQDFVLLCPDANRRTLQRDLKGLLDAGILTTKGATHQLVYSLKGNVL